MIKQLQNKKLSLLLFSLLLGLSGTANLIAQEPTPGVIGGAFTVNANGDQVVFSQGNLQYIGSGSTPYWKFADHQWDYLGNNGQDSFEPDVDRDLFGWGTSGYNHGAIIYQPWDMGWQTGEYYVYGEGYYNLYDQNGRADWGYNPISNGGNQENNGWRTLTREEWEYLLDTRSTPSGIRYAKANVNNVNGVVLLPDDWSTNYHNLSNTNTADANFSGNIISVSEWSKLEQFGAIFLPAAGEFGGATFFGFGDSGSYWSSSCDKNNQENSYYMRFDDSFLTAQYNWIRRCSLSVRLIRSEVSFGINATPNSIESGSVNGAGVCPMGSDCTLVAAASPDYTFVFWEENGVIVSTNAIYSFTVTRERNLMAIFSSNNPIVFNDANVKTLCVAPATGWDTNGDGELSYAEAATVTSIGTVFKGDTNIQSFNELQHFISLTAIDEQAFRNCSNLAEITIPEHVASMGSRAFWNCPALATVHFNAINCASMSNTINGENYSVFMSSTTSYPLTNLTIGSNIRHIPDYAFRGCNNIQNLDNLASVITIGDYAFYECTSLETLTIGGGTIGEHAFHSCSGLESLTIGEGSTTIVDDYAFYDCTELETLTIGEGVTSIGEYAFWNCPSLTTVHFNATNCIKMSTPYYDTFDYSPFNSGTTHNSTPIVTLTIGDNVTCIPSGAFMDSPNATGNLTIPNSVTSIGKQAFYGCSGFTGPLTIPNSLTSIEKNAFFGCSGFTGSLIIPNSATEIGEYAFAYCSGFDGTLIIGCNVVEIWQYAFYNCNFTALIVESSNVPFVNGENENQRIIFNHYDIPVYVPGGNISEYQNEIGWRFFTNFKSQVNFIQDVNTNWSNEDNWSNWEGPSSEDVVCITDNCQLDVDANVLYVYIADDAKVLTVNSGKTLNTTYGVHIENASQLVVEDGAQVISDIPFSGTVQKHIDAYTGNDDGWNFIASPVMENQSISGLIPTGGTVFDLYYLDEETSYWKNYKVNTFDINHKQGYLYANQGGTDINFSGNMQPYVVEGVSIPLTKEGEGWNLVGNPFTFNAYANKPYYVINGRNVEAATSGAIAPCTGIVVKANGTENETVTFTKDAPVTSSAPSNGSLQVILAETNNTRGASQIDNAIVSFNEGETLPKFRFGDNTQIYFPKNGEDYAIANAEKTGEMPVNFKATRNGEYTLTVNPESVEMEYLHLIDNLTGNDVDLLAAPSYTFQARTDDYASRFRLVFSANSIDDNNVEPDNDFAFISNGELIINGTGTFQVIDMLGRQLFSREAYSDFRLQTSDFFTSGVYMLRLVDGENVKTQKIVIR